MEPGIYRQYFELEQRHWWFVGMRRLCEALLAGLPGTGPGGRRYLDIGCGTGLWTRQLEAHGTVIGLDCAPEALAFCRTRGLRRLVRGEAQQLPLVDEAFDVVTALGLMEHVEDDEVFLAEVFRVCRPGGQVVLLTSAHQQLWSRHDELVHHKRRYARRQLQMLLAGQGFEVLKVSYVNTLLLPAILGMRALRALLGRTPQAEATTPDMFAVPGWLNACLLGILRTEQAWLRVADLPFGLGLVAVARRGGAVQAPVTRVVEAVSYASA